MADDTTTRASFNRFQLAFSAPERARHWLAQHTNADGSEAQRRLYSQQAQAALDDYVTILAADLASVTLTTPEALLICDIRNGTRLEPATARLLWAEVADSAPDGMAEKWGADIPALVAKLRSYSPGQCWAIYDAVQRW